jgi:WD40 repeat protein
LEHFDKIIKINKLLGHNGSIYGLLHHPGSTYFYSIASDGWIVKWDADGRNSDGKLIANADAKLFSATLIGHENLLIAGDINGHLYWIDLENNTILARTIAHSRSIFDIKVIDESNMITISGDGYMTVWDIQIKLPIISIKISNQGLRCATYDEIDKKIYIGSSDNNIYIVSTENWNIVEKIVQAHANSVFAVELLGPKLLASGGRDAHFVIRAWHDNEEKIIVDHPAHWYTINKIKHLPQVNMIVTASRDKTFRLWNDQTYQPIKTIDVFKDGHHHSINTLLWIAESKILLTAGDDRIINMWQL